MTIDQMPNGMSTSFHGPYGTALRLDIPDRPEAAQTVDHWLITAPPYHPLWSQYVLCVVRLDDLPGWPAPYRQFEGATHELIVVTLNPEHGPYDVDKMAGYANAAKLPILTPVNIAHQLTASDDELREVAALAAWAVVNGHLNPETADAPERIRRAWLASLTKTLAHIRGEAHAS